MTVFLQQQQQLQHLNLQALRSTSAPLHFGWILVKGVGVAATNVAVVAGDELALGGAAGELTTLAAGKGVGLALAAGGGATSVKLDI